MVFDLAVQRMIYWPLAHTPDRLHSTTTEKHPVSIRISRAFNRVGHDGLLSKLFTFEFPFLAYRGQQFSSVSEPSPSELSVSASSCKYCRLSRFSTCQHPSTSIVQSSNSPCSSIKQSCEGCGFFYYTLASRTGSKKGIQLISDHSLTSNLQSQPSSNGCFAISFYPYYFGLVLRNFPEQFLSSSPL